MKLTHPMQNPELRPYLDDVRTWHGYVRFLGLPTIQDNPDTPIDSLFVPPLLAEEAVSPDSDPANWPMGKDVFTLLKYSRRLVILGDPGGGKTTLLNWLSWLLVSGRVGAIPEWLDGVFPVPLILRELDLRKVSDFDSLLDAFLKRPVAEKLSDNKVLLIDYLQKGKVLVLVDGFDEVPRSLQIKIRNALLEGFESYPDSFFVASSRMVGYEDCPLDRGISCNIFLNKLIAQNSISENNVASNFDDLLQNLEITNKFIIDDIRTKNKNIRNYFSHIGEHLKIDQRGASLAYVMPFDNQRIRDFAHSWYRLRMFRQIAANDADEFIRAVFANTTTLRLARTPQLLTLMALVFRVRAQLPNGRALLYDLISEAYLESIDRSRKLAPDPYPWKEKRRWLARIGFEMQCLRTAEKSQDDNPDDKELLVGRKQVLNWIQQAMEQSGYPKNAAFAEDYLNWIARRSGLLLPRGGNLFAFLHLSFQEYFAALYLGEHLSDADWVISQRDGISYTEGDSRVTTQAIQDWANDARWQEVLVFCFEEFAHSPKESRRLSEWIYGQAFSKFIEVADSLDEGPGENKAELLARVVVDPHSGLSPQDKDGAFLALCRYSMSPTTFPRQNGLLAEGFELNETGALRLLLSNPSYENKFWQIAEKTNIISVDIAHLTNDFLIRLSNWKNIVTLFIMDSDKLYLESLSHLTDLETLFIAGNISSTDLTPLAALTNLRYIYISGKKFSDLTPIRNLIDLYQLTLTAGHINDITPLANLKNLERLSLDQLQISDLTPLAGLVKIRTLSLSRSKVNDLNYLVGLTRLEFLDISNTALNNLEPLCGLTNLKRLVMNGTKVSDLSPLAGLINMEWLVLSETPVSDLAPLTGLSNLKKLYLKETKVTDLEPLASLRNLELLDLTGTKVKSLAPLSRLKQIKIEGFKKNPISRKKKQN